MIFDHLSFIELAFEIYSQLIDTSPIKLGNLGQIVKDRFLVILKVAHRVVRVFALKSQILEAGYLLQVLNLGELPDVVVVEVYSSQVWSDLPIDH